MSDNFEMLVDVDAAAEEAKDVARAVLDRFRKLGWITGQADSECVLGGEGYRPEPAIADWYKLPKREYPFWKLHTCGVEPRVGREFNAWALGPVFQGFICPSCAAEFGDELGDSVGDAISEWWHESGPALVACPKCRMEHSITEWQCKPPLGFGNLSFTFWNWPRLDSPSWVIDIAGIVRDITGHRIVRTYGHI